MSWSLSFLKPREPELLDALFLSVGRALHLANAYEDKCQYVLRIGNLITAHQSDPAMTFEEAVASVPADKRRHAAQPGLTRHGQDHGHGHTLHKAREARNWIAHEGASIGTIWSIDRDGVLQHAAKLRAAVTDLALGDNIISQWCHGLDEPHDPPPTDWINGYPDVVDTWVFGHLRGLLPKQAPCPANS
ncbi:hypothetical protein [Streptomyces bobili]|uniref:hypothetical protein n=1 Tax=Streptomyces bobili TaxID=67280 RepID=UPI0037174A37